MMSKILDKILLKEDIDWKKLNHSTLRKYVMDGSLANGDVLLIKEKQILWVAPDDSGRILQTFAYYTDQMLTEDVSVLRGLFVGEYTAKELFIERGREAFNTSLAEAVTYQFAIDVESGDLSALYEMIYRLCDEGTDRIMVTNILRNYLEEEAQDFMEERMLEF